MSGTTGGVASFNGRTGAVLPDAGDYDAEQVGAVASPISPSPRNSMVCCPDPNGGVMLFGGYGAPGVALGDTWVFGAAGWVPYKNVIAPASRSAAAAARSAEGAPVVMFGGQGADEVMADTWLWDGNNWSPQSPPNSPQSRSGHTMVRDPLNNRVILFGGADAAGNLLNDTWAWTGSTWLQLNPAASPPARYAATAAEVTANGTAVLFGGVGAAGTGAPLGDTWIWDGVSWAEAAPASAPTARYGAAMVGDFTLSHPILFGGQGSLGSYLGDLWMWESATPNWVEQAQGAVLPAPRAQAGFADWYNNSNGFLFGGESTYAPTDDYLGDSWNYLGNGGWQLREGGGAQSPPLTGQNLATPPAASPTTYQLTSEAVFYVAGGTVSEITVGGFPTGLTSGTVIVPANTTVTITWTVAPTVIALVI